MPEILIVCVRKQIRGLFTDQKYLPLINSPSNHTKNHGNWIFALDDRSRLWQWQPVNQFNKCAVLRWLSLLWFKRFRFMNLQSIEEILNLHDNKSLSEASICKVNWIATLVLRGSWNGTTSYLWLLHARINQRELLQLLQCKSGAGRIVINDKNDDPLVNILSMHNWLFYSR